MDKCFTITLSNMVFLVSIYYIFFFFFPKLAGLLVSIFFWCLSFAVQIFRIIQALMIRWDSHRYIMWILFIVSIGMNIWTFSFGTYWSFIPNTLITALLLPPTFGGYLFITFRSVSEMLPSKGLRGSLVLIFVLTFAFGVSLVKRCCRSRVDTTDDEETDFSNF